MSMREIKETCHVGNETAQKLYQVLNTDPRIYQGRPPVTFFILNYVHQYKSDFNVGYQKLYQVSQKKNEAPKTPTEWKVRKVFD